MAAGITTFNSLRHSGAIPGIVLGAADPLEVSPLLLIGGRRSIAGWPSGRSVDSQDTPRFSAMTGVGR
jgi:hypothetical protein